MAHALLHPARTLQRVLLLRHRGTAPGGWDSVMQLRSPQCTRAAVGIRRARRGPHSHRGRWGPHQGASPSSAPHGGAYETPSLQQGASQQQQQQHQQTASSSASFSSQGATASSSAQGAGGAAGSQDEQGSSSAFAWAAKAWGRPGIPCLHKVTKADLQRLAMALLLLGLLTVLDVAIEGRLGSFVDAALSSVLELWVIFVLLDLSLTTATWVVSSLAFTVSLATCPWCNYTFKFDRQAAQQHHAENAAEGGGKMICPSCFGELAYMNSDSEPYFAKSTRQGFSGSHSHFQSASWTGGSHVRIVDVDAIVQDKE